MPLPTRFRYWGVLIVAALLSSALFIYLVPPQHGNAETLQCPAGWLFLEGQCVQPCDGTLTHGVCSRDSDHDGVPDAVDNCLGVANPSQLDTDHDGIISASEIRNSVAALKTLDKNGDGQITEDEVRPAFGPGRDRRPDGGPRQ